ncbi:MAG: ferric reductase-like transmembrane domain-containing protein [Burkholderiaceae bacterium]|nr:ferric reductase-like transmembrane domain-containing protein [Burkholderiaceae bacterium]MCD8537563.1 ferric reductase-like transmembrane domain-containing protein [Burkholderiaceae bacterium]
MNRIRIAWLIVFSLLSIVYWVSLTPVELTFEPWALRKSLLYYSGIIAIGMMSVGMILAMRLQSIESLLGGLDKHYRLHKWLGISAVIAAVVHWLVKLEPKWLAKHGFVPPDTFKTPEGVVGFFDRADPFSAIRGFAKDLGEWTIYALIVLAIFALWRKLPYRQFFKTHRLMAIIYLLLAFHSVVLFSKLGWQSPIGWLMAALLAAGVIGAIVSLIGKTGYRHQHEAKLTQVQEHAQDNMIEVHAKVDASWPGHEPGQFAFLVFNRQEGAHPFSISSAWDSETRDISFHIKRLGDFTKTLPTTLTIGQVVGVQGPYGRFEFEPQDADQIWIAGGVGLTPFLARLQSLPEGNQPNLIHFYLCVRDEHTEVVDQINALCQAKGVQLTTVVSGKHEPLTGARIRQENPHWQNCHVWFCGPTGLGASVREDLKHHGLAGKQFHQELFEMR